LRSRRLAARRRGVRFPPGADLRRTHGLYGRRRVEGSLHPPARHGRRTRPVLLAGRTRRLDLAPGREALQLPFVLSLSKDVPGSTAIPTAWECPGSAPKPLGQLLHALDEIIELIARRRFYRHVRPLVRTVDVRRAHPRRLA